MQLRIVAAVQGCSDSSMVDEYMEPLGTDWSTTRVQIPLWSMNTFLGMTVSAYIRSSDSSMVDEYGQSRISDLAGVQVQIPLWSMNTRAWLPKTSQ